MATLTSFRASGICSECCAYGSLWVSNDFGSRGNTYRIGDDVDDDVGDDFVTHSFLVREPREGEPAHVLATWTCETCHRYSFAELVFADGWLVDLQAVEPTVATLDRIHYIPTYESSQVEDLLGRSMWDEQDLWPGWLPALREALARREAAAPEAHGERAEGDFLLGGTFDGGRYKIVEHYMGGGADQLWFARSTADPSARYLVSTTADNGLKISSDGPELLRTAAGLFTPRFLGSFDRRGDGGEEDRERDGMVAYVEQVPLGWPLPKTRISTKQYAFLLAAQAAEKLLAAAAAGVLPVGLRPEYVWAVNRPSGPQVTGLGGRSFSFFGAARRRRDLPTAPLFTLQYFAPEVRRGEPFDDRALVLTLAVITAEWLLGRYPYEPDGAWGHNHLCRGEHVELPVRARDLIPALRPDPADRPSLADFARTLRVLARSQLA
jgi:hypothetical protein